jgi:hypothetical protein
MTGFQVKAQLPLRHLLPYRRLVLFPDITERSTLRSFQKVERRPALQDV